MRNTQALANAIHEAYKAADGQVLIDVGDDGITCVQNLSFYVTVGGYLVHDEATGITHEVYDAPGAARIYS